MPYLPTSLSAAERGPRLSTDPTATLFDRFAYLYAFFRERVFQDDTEDIVQLLASFGFPLHTAKIVELGCGPGFYATRIARRFRLLDVIGVDASPKLVERSRLRAGLLRLSNCHFMKADVRSLPFPAGTVHAVISSRLFMVLEQREVVMAEAYRALHPGGLFFVAEPLPAIWARLPLWILQSLGNLRGGTGFPSPGGIRACLLSGGDFRDLFASQPWARIVHWQTKSYQYAVALKACGQTLPSA